MKTTIIFDPEGNKSYQFIFNPDADSDLVERCDWSRNVKFREEIREWLATNLVETPKISPGRYLLSLTLVNERDIVLFKMFHC